MKNRQIVLLFMVSCVQAYLGYLQHYQTSSFGVLDWLIGAYSIPVYILMLPIVLAIEALFGWEWYRSINWFFPHLTWQAWAFSVLILMPLNRLGWRGCQRLYHSPWVARLRARR